jgi:dTMP kinase
MRSRLSRFTAAAGGWRPLASQSATQRLPGWFIAVEGGDGAGKSTQIEALARWLGRRGFEVVTTREPGATELGAKLREILLHAEEHAVGARAEALLFAADRADHVEKVVRPALERGAIVLTDRHVDSSIAYQSGGRGLAADEVAALSAFATDGLRPNLVVLLDIDPALAWERAQTRSDGPDKLEAEPAEFHARVRRVFRDRAAAEPARYLMVDASEPAGVITAIIEDRLEQLLPLSAKEAAEARERERAQRAALEAERREQEARLAVERAAAEKEAERLRAEQEKARQEEERRREEVRREQARQAAEERARLEQEKAEQQRRAEVERRAAEARDAERRQQEAADVEHRRQVELAARQTEARAKGQAREQATRELTSRAESEARTARLVEVTRRERNAAIAAPAKTAAIESGEPQTAVLPLDLDLDPTQALRPAHGRRVGDDDDDWDEDDDDAPRSRWRLGKRKS